LGFRKISLAAYKWVTWRRALQGRPTAQARRLCLGLFLIAVLGLRGCGVWHRLGGKWDEWERSSPEYKRRQAELALKERLAGQKWTLELTVCRVPDIGIWDPGLVGLPPVGPAVLHRSFLGTREHREWARRLWDSVERIAVDSLQVQLVYDGEEGMSPESYSGPIRHTDQQGKVVFSDIPGGYYAHIPNAYLIVVWSGNHPDLELLETVERFNIGDIHEPRGRPRTAPFVLPAVAVSSPQQSVSLGLLIGYGYRVPVYLHR